MRKMVVALLVLASLLVLTVGAVGENNDAWIPGLASLVVPGLGQFINDQLDKAFLHFGVAIAIDVGTYYLTSLLPYPYGYYSYPLVGLAHLGWAVYSAYDAYSVAKEQNFTIGLNENGIGFSYNF